MPVILVRKVLLVSRALAAARLIQVRPGLRERLVRSGLARLALPARLESQALLGALVRLGSLVRRGTPALPVPARSQVRLAR